MMLRRAEILLTVMLQVETGLGEVFIPVAPSGTFYAETYDAGVQCYSHNQNASNPYVTSAAGHCSPRQWIKAVCAGGDPASIDGGVASGGTGTYTYHGNRQQHRQVLILPIAGAIAATYDPPSGFSQTTYFRRITRSSTCLQTGSPVMISLGAAPCNHRSSLCHNRYATDKVHLSRLQLWVAH